MDAQTRSHTVAHHPYRVKQISNRSLYGIWANLSPVPTDADLDDARREMWANSPREDST